MLRSLALALLCVAFAAMPAAAKKKPKHKPAHAAKLAKLKLKKPKALALRAPTKVAPEVHTAPPVEVATPPPEPTIAPPHVMGPQDSDDEVPGSRMKK